MEAYAIQKSSKQDTFEGVDFSRLTIANRGA